MNSIAVFLTHPIVYICIYFIYGLAFFSMGLALEMAGRQRSSFRFAAAVAPMALFGFLHGTHEWLEMFQHIARQGGVQFGVAFDALRLACLVLSFLALLVFGIRLTGQDTAVSPWRRYWLLTLLSTAWAVSVAAVMLRLKPAPLELIAMADVLARYLLAIPGALLGAWGMMNQQHSFREQDMSRFGRDLVWCAAALILYGSLGQLFVRPTALPPSTVLNSETFLAWFGIPIQLFRAFMASVLTVYLVRVLRVFELESRRQLEEANRTSFESQARALDAERRNLSQISSLNDELRMTAHELALLVELSNMLVMPIPLAEKLTGVLQRVVDNLHFADAGMILLLDLDAETVRIAAHVGFVNVTAPADPASRFGVARTLGERSIAQRLAFCQHADGEVLQMSAELTMLEQLCRRHRSPTLYIALPLQIDHAVIGSLSLARARQSDHPLAIEDLQLLSGIAQQLGLSIYNARLSQQVQARERRLGELLRSVVSAQENERRRIARELHDATGQALTAVALGLRGLQTSAAGSASLSLSQVGELEAFATTALGELHGIITDLRPPQLDDLGLTAALRWYVQEFGKRRQIRATYRLEGQVIPLPSEYETVIFRTTQEALTNVAKHACASSVAVTLSFAPPKVQVTICDDGCGFVVNATDDDSRTGWGLLGMRERAGLLGGYMQIQSTPGEGTCIRVEIPLPYASTGDAVERLQTSVTPLSERNDHAATAAG